MTADHERAQLRELRELHTAFNVAVRREGGHAPACDGPECRVCEALREAVSRHAPAETKEKEASETVYLVEGKDEHDRTMYWTGLIDSGRRADFNYDAWCAVHFHKRDYAECVQQAYPELKNFFVVQHGFVYDAVRPPTSDAVCEHGTALDVHCCNCHSGFIFDRDHECAMSRLGEPEAQIAELTRENDARERVIQNIVYAIEGKPMPHDDMRENGIVRRAVRGLAVLEAENVELKQQIEVQADAHVQRERASLKAFRERLAVLEAREGALRTERDRFKATLERIADPPSDGCGCEHDTADCCANVRDYHCPECIAHAALLASSSPAGETPQENT